MKRVLVIGSGVIGLTTAITLLQDGHVVTIWTEKLSRNTTVTSATDYAPEDLIVSDVAAASFIPHTKQPNEREVSWLAISSKMFMAEAAQRANQSY
jgi:glycine/D-amino acid oxidase-like deaminating enzyme